MSYSNGETQGPVSGLNSVGGVNSTRLIPPNGLERHKRVEILVMSASDAAPLGTVLYDTHLYGGDRELRRRQSAYVGRKARTCGSPHRPPASSVPRPSDPGSLLRPTPLSPTLLPGSSATVHPLTLKRL